MSDEFAQLARHLLEGGDFDEFSKRMEAAIAVDRLAAAKKQLELSRQEVSAGLQALKDLGILEKPVLRTVAREYWELSQRAKTRDFKAFLKLLEDLETALRQEFTWVMGDDFGGMVIRKDRSNLGKPVVFMGSALELYAKRLAYYVGLIEIAQEGSANVDSIMAMTTDQLELRLQKGRQPLTATCVLGDEYRRLRNSIKHQTYEVRGRGAQLTFEDHHGPKRRWWTKTYSFAEFNAVFELFQSVFFGIQLARSVEHISSFRTYVSVYSEMEKREKYGEEPAPHSS